LFSSRDCFLWHELYRALFPDATGTEYFYTSRRVRVDPSPGYRAYARDRLSPDSLLIDICGTGWSSAMLMEALDLPGRALFFLHRIPPIAVYEQRRPTPGICRVHELIGPDREALQNGRLEICNYAPHGTVVGVRMTEGVPVPAFDVEDRSAAQLTLVDQQIDCFRTMTRDACANLPRGCIWLTNREITDVVGALYALLCLETCIPNAFAMSHNREDLQALSAMRFPPP
jgi:hypothetical protein